MIYKQLLEDIRTSSGQATELRIRSDSLTELIRELNRMNCSSTIPDIRGIEFKYFEGLKVTEYWNNTHFVVDNTFQPKWIIK